jgi:hypothetical protein
MDLVQAPQSCFQARSTITDSRLFAGSYTQLVTLSFELYQDARVPQSLYTPYNASLPLDPNGACQKRQYLHLEVY